MPSLLIRHTVTDFDTWRRAFDEDAETRRANGSGVWHAFRNSAEPNEVWILLEWDDLMRARLFTKSDDLIDLLNPRRGHRPAGLLVLGRNESSHALTRRAPSIPRKAGITQERALKSCRVPFAASGSGLTILS